MPTSTISLPFSTCSTPSAGCWGSPCGGRSRFRPAGAHWYAVPRVGFPDRDTFHATYDAVGSELDRVLAKHDLPPERMVLGGFSQGAVMSYALGLGEGRPRPAGVLALSGFIPTVEGFAVDPANAAGLPVAIGHGEQDPVISVEFARDARDRLAAAGAELTYRESPMGHRIDPTFLAELQGWLAGRRPGRPEPGLSDRPAGSQRVQLGGGVHVLASAQVVAGRSRASARSAAGCGPRGLRSRRAGARTGPAPATPDDRARRR